MDIVDLGGVFSIQWFVSERVAGPVADPASDSPATEPIGKAVGVMITPFATLGARHSPEFCGP